MHRQRTVWLAWDIWFHTALKISAIWISCLSANTSIFQPPQLFNHPHLFLFRMNLLLLQDDCDHQLIYHSVSKPSTCPFSLNGIRSIIIFVICFGSRFFHVLLFYAQSVHTLLFFLIEKYSSPAYHNMFCFRISQVINHYEILLTSRDIISRKTLIWYIPVT